MADVPNPSQSLLSASNTFSFDYEPSLPGPDDDEFKQFVFGAPGRKIPSYELTEEERISIPGEAEYASYGDEGTTATVNAYGSVIQITRYLGIGRSGFFSVDLEHIHEPYFVQPRADQLMKCAADLDGIYFAQAVASYPELDSCYENPWQLEFVHDRWPRLTSAPTAPLIVTTQHYASKGTIFHTDHYESKTSRANVISSSSTRFYPNWIKIRELEFMDPGYKFNENNDYDDCLGPHGFSFLIARSGVVLDSRVELQEESPDTVVLIGAIFVNGEVRELERVCETGIDHHCYRVKLKEGEDGFWAGPNEPLHITYTFRLELMRRRCDWRQCLISDDDFLSSWTAFSTKSFTRLPFSDDKDLDLAMRRNLEHILSVCSIPVAKTSAPSRVDQGDGGNKVVEEEEVIALTCGDLSGHRLVTSASFFAFKFLLSMYDHINETEKEHRDSCKCSQNDSKACILEFSKVLRGRIKRTCKGHLAWIRRAKLDDGCFGTHYWATGETIERYEDKREVLSMRSLTDTPFQIVKLADYTMKWRDEDEHDVIMSDGDIERFVRPWLRKLDEQNKRGFYAFPRPAPPSHAGYQNYRLEDHVWIWRALLSIDAVGFGDELSKEKKVRRNRRKGQKDTVNQQKASHEANPLVWDYSPTEFQRHVFRRFTSQNTVSRQRMLAVARSSSENRFFLRARDTALMYEAETPFFTNSDTLWKATMDSQKFHEENQDSTWDSPLRYGLALMMAAKGLQINSKPPGEMSQTAKNVLYQSLLGSGLFPGQVNMATKEPELFEHERWRDFYWHVTFEVPYILWEIHKHENADKEEADGIQLLPRFASPSRQVTKTRVDLPAQDQPIGHGHPEMKRLMPSNNFIDLQSIVEISDEWLYPYPDFLDFDPSGDISPDMVREVKNIIDPESFMNDFQEPFLESSCGEVPCPLKGVVIDIPKTNHGAKGKREIHHGQGLENTPQPRCSHALYQKLKGLRTAMDAKKRLVWLPDVDCDTAFCCLLVSPKSETGYLSSFFDRHKHTEKYFFDETVATSNLWRTEFHLSSYQLLEGDGHGRKSTSDADLRFLGGGRTISRSGMGFRFVGDFFDRYWTCHILGPNPMDDPQLQKTKEDSLVDGSDRILERLKRLVESEEVLHKIERDKKPWRQRKVLELLLFDSMLEKIVVSYEAMLKEVGGHLRHLLPLQQSDNIASSDILTVSSALFSSRMNSNAYLSVSKEWPPFQYTLQVMEEDLQETLEKIELWNAREKDRKPESPRWTRNDESKYRSVITKLRASNVHKIREIERYLSKVQSLRNALASRLASTRDDLSFRSAENVRFFTYVTVVFLPLGFATAIFSMNGAPPSKVLIGMVVASPPSSLLSLP